MSNTLVNLARVQSTTLGQGTLTLGAAIAGFNTFSGAGLTDGQTVTYCIEDYSPDVPATVTGREIGQGVYSAGTLTRATVYSSTLAGAKLNCSGRQHVLVTPSAEDLASFATDLTAHLNDTAGAHAASAISFSATGGIASTDVQAAIAELDSEKLAVASNLSDLASASTARTNLGLGTAAVQNTGTSGATLPLLNGTNTWSAINTFSSGQIFGGASTMATGEVNTVSTDAGAGFGPLVRYIRDSASPAANDGLGGFQFLGRSNAAGEITYADVLAQAIAVSAGSTQGHLRFRTDTNGSAVSRLTLQLGAQIGSPTGGDKGAGTLNATTLYEAGTALTAKYAQLGTANVLTGILSVNGAGANAPLCVKSDFGTYGALNSGVRVETAAVATVGALCEIASGEGAVRLYSGGSEIIRLRSAGASYFGAQAFGLGTTSPDRRLHSEVDDATTNAVTQVARFTHTTSGTPATGIGVGIEFEVETAAGNNEVGATIEVISTDVTSTSEDFDISFKAMAAGAAAVEVGRMTSKGTYKTPSFTVAGLPAGTAGEIAFASNGRKNGEGAAAGTGVLVFHDGTAWRACDTGATVAA